jgi:NAD(P) transhydrogenase subunit beta
LAGKLRQTTVVLKGHTVWVSVFLLFILGMAVVVASGGPDVLTVGLLTLASAAMMTGVLVAVRVGGADMPVMISFLNAASGLAAACCGIVVGNRLLVVCGATVGASGTILTGVMCRAMNRNMLSIFTGLAHHNVTTTPVSAPVSAPEPLPLNLEPPLERGIVAVREARRVVFVPGYGMALGQAQFEVVKLASLLERRGVHVRFAVHPVAGRMPGHMNVLLAEADVSYDQLIEMDEANTLFPDTDLAIVVGACDVVNPAAGNTEGTPISGMPVLRVQEARRVIVCNLDSKPGYSGVANTLYEMPHVILLFGQAKETLAQIIEGAAAGQ